MAFFGTKSTLTQKIPFQTHFFFKILKAVCLGFVHMTDIGQIPFQIIEQKLVQRCETHIKAQSCKASLGRSKATKNSKIQTTKKTAKRMIFKGDSSLDELLSRLLERLTVFCSPYVLEYLVEPIIDNEKFKTLR